MNLKCIMLSEVSQAQKPRYCLIPFIWHSGEVKAMVTESRSMGMEEGYWERELREILEVMEMSTMTVWYLHFFVLVRIIELYAGKGEFL